MQQYLGKIEWKHNGTGFKRFDWSPYREPRFVMAASTAAAFLILAGGYIHWNMSRTQAWTEVFTNGTYAGLVPNEAGTLSKMKRTAEGYDVKLQLSTVHQYVPTSYNWQSVTKLPTTAYEIALDGKPLVYTPSATAANSVISSVKKRLTPQHLKPNATVAFDGTVSIHKTIVGVADILAAPSAVSYILHPGNGTSLASRSSDPLGTQVQAVAENVSLTRSSKSKGTTQEKVKNPLIDVKVSQVVTKKVKVPFHVTEIKDSKLGVGTVKVTRPGVKGVDKETIQQVYKDGKLVSHKVLKKVVLSHPKDQIERRGTNPGVASGSWAWPSPDYDITSGYGPRLLYGRYNFHPGIDIGCPVGTPVYATNNGVVEQAGWNNGGYGIWIKINNGRGIESIFGHLSRVAVHAGQTIAKGQVIGYSGDTGFATGPHLHYEVRKYGQHINPTPYM